MGGSGTLIYDHQRNITVALTGTVDAFTTSSAALMDFEPVGQIFKTSDPVLPGIVDYKTDVIIRIPNGYGSASVTLAPLSQIPACVQKGA